MFENNTSLRDGLFSQFANCACTVAENPLWNEDQQTLYWVDVTNGIVYCKKYEDGDNCFKRFDLKLGKIGGMVFLRDNTLLLFAAQGKVWHWSPEADPELYAELPEAVSSRFNDVIADPEGRVYCGVAPVLKGCAGSLWRMNADKSFSCLEPFTKGMPNGMAFSPDLKYLYFTVTDERTIYRYSYNGLTGNISDKKVFIKVPDEEGSPDGMTIDAEGCIWSAQWNGSRLVRYAPTGEKLFEYNFLIAKISCITFGGANYSELFVTTANYPLNKTDYEKYGAGTVFQLKQSIAGLPEYKINYNKKFQK